MTNDEWYERERAAFIAWWEPEGQAKFGATPTLAAGAGWLAKAEAVRPEDMEHRLEVARESGYAQGRASTLSAPMPAPEARLNVATCAYCGEKRVVYEPQKCE